MAVVTLSLQELAVPVVHDGGALLAFVCGVGYTPEEAALFL